jgi:hypothetical protein
MKTLIGAGTEVYIELAPTTQVFIELAPGTVLCGLLKQIDPAQKSLNVENAASLEKTLTELAGINSSGG